MAGQYRDCSKWPQSPPFTARSTHEAVTAVNVTIDFMRGGTGQMTYAVGLVTRLGRTMANVEARAWQDDADKPIAMATMHYLIGGPKNRHPEPVSG
jgi:acyl-coenzyme A thioesterase PaaI-like protein